MRDLAELTGVDEPALPLLRDWVAASGGRGRLLPPVDPLRSETILALQVTTRSPLGAVAHESGGLLAGDGLLRLLGSGAERSLLRANAAAGVRFDSGPPDLVVVADDVLGGLFALNGGRFRPGSRGEVFHLAADATAWIALGRGYTDFVHWCLAGNLDGFYGPLAALDACRRRPRAGIDRCHSFYPFLWTAEAGSGAVDARLVDADESLALRVALLGFAVG